MARLYMEKIGRRHDDKRERDRALITGECASVLYSLAFLNESERASIRLLVDEMGNSTEKHPADIASTMRHIASVCNELASRWDRVREEMA